MHILKNTIKNLFRNKMRSFFYLTVALMMISSIAMSVIINSNTNTVISKYKQSFESDVQIKINQEKLVEGALSGLSIIDYEPSASDYINFADSKYVKEAIFTGSMAGYMEELKGDIDKTIKRNVYEELLNVNNCNVIGYSSQNNKYNLVGINIKEGRMFENNNECIVKEAFLNSNNVNIGDEINILNGRDIDNNKKLSLKIVGVYEDKVQTNTENEFYMQDLVNNNILTSYSTLSDFENIFSFNKPAIYTNAKFKLKDSKSREKFESELRGKGLKEIYKVTINEDEYRKVVEPVEHLSKVASISMYVMLILGLSLLIMISILSLKNIKYEIGVFRAIGVSKFRLVQEYLYEGIIITTICLILGMGIAMVSAQPISDYLFKSQEYITQQQGESILSDEIIIGDIGSKISNENDKKDKNEIKNIKIIITKESIVKVVIISVLLSLLISIVAIYNTIIYKPIQILSDRN